MLSGELDGEASFGSIRVFSTGASSIGRVLHPLSQAI